MEPQKNHITNNATNTTPTGIRNCFDVILRSASSNKTPPIQSDNKRQADHRTCRYNNRPLDNTWFLRNTKFRADSKRQRSEVCNFQICSIWLRKRLALHSEADWVQA